MIFTALYIYIYTFLVLHIQQIQLNYGVKESIMDVAQSPCHVVCLMETAIMMQNVIGICNVGSKIVHGVIMMTAVLKGTQVKLI